MNNLLDKFDEIEIKQTDKIDQEDRIFCEIHERMYKQAYQTYSEMLEKLNNIFQIQKDETKIAMGKGILGQYDNSAYEYVPKYSDGGTNDIGKALKNTTDRFVNHLIHYFKKKYQINIESVYEFKDNDECFTLEYVLEKYIFAHLDGFNFQEKAIDEIKQKARMPLGWYEYRKYWNYEVKGKTIKFRTNIDDIKPALYYFDNNEKGLIDCYMHNKVDDYTSYDNGNTNIKFYNASYALDFAKRYLGYIEMTEQEREEYKKKCSNW